MDNISKENLKELDPHAGQEIEWNDEASEALPDVFGNRVILNLILEHLPNSKLLELSFVSKLWKEEARIVMKKRSNVMAFLKCDGARECRQVFEAFVANLEALNEDLYSGMTISLRKVADWQGTGALEVERLHESILTGMRGKLIRLSIQLGPSEVCWKNARDCPISVLLRLLLRDLIGDLEHLTLEVWRIMELFIQEFLPHRPYPKLKVLKLNDIYTSSKETFGNLTRMLLSRAPNLQEIRTHGNISLRKNLMEGRDGALHVHESIVLDPMGEISENVNPSLRLKWTCFHYNTEPEFELDRFNEKAQKLLRTCCATSLESLTLDAVSAVLLISYGIPLVKVKTLEIMLDLVWLEQFDPRIKSILSRCDFTYLFPNLKEVDIDEDSDPPSLDEITQGTMDAIVEQGNVVWTDSMLPRAGNIKTLTLSQSSITTSAVQFFAHMLPSIQELEVGGLDIQVGSAWELWPDLKWMSINGKRYQRPKSRKRTKRANK